MTISRRAFLAAVAALLAMPVADCPQVIPARCDCCCQRPPSRWVVTFSNGDERASFRGEMACGGGEFVLTLI